MILSLILLAQSSDLGLLFEKAAKEGLSQLLLVIGIYVVGKLMLKSQDRANMVQDLRIQDLKDQVNVLQKKCDACETDRQRLWERLAEIDPNCPYTPKAPPINIS